MNGLFITGTCTNVGKTVITAALLKAFLLQQKECIVAKPFQTGCDDNIPDIDTYIEATSITYSKEDLALACPYAFKDPCSPHLAASNTGAVISLEHTLSSLEQLAEKYDVTLVEGAGGILVPLTEHKTMLDFAAMLKMPILLVSANILGCINHTLLTVEAIKNRGLEIAGIVMKEITPRTPEDSFIRDDNPRIIEKLSGIKIQAEIPYYPELGNTEYTEMATKLNNLCELCS